LKKNEISRLVDGVRKIDEQVKQFSKPDGSFQSDKTIAPLEDTRYSLFVINILEDLTQDILYYYGNGIVLETVNRIYQNVPRMDETYKFITG
jgi:hypothetical protein